MSNRPTSKRAYARTERMVRVRELAQAYRTLGTLDQVAAQAGLTRERVRQLLALGHAQGWCTYDAHHVGQRVKRAKKALERAESLDQFMEQLRYKSSNAGGARLWDALGVTRDEAMARFRENKCRRLLKDLYAHAMRLGTPELCTTLLDQDVEARNCLLRVKRFVGNGSIEEIRQVFGLPAVRLECNGKWSEHR